MGRPKLSDEEKKARAHASRQRWLARNPDYYRVYIKKWRNTNKDKVRVYNQINYERRKQSAAEGLD